MALVAMPSEAVSREYSKDTPMVVAACAADRELARTRAYEGIDRLALAGGQARRDIARAAAAPATREDAAWKS